MWSISLPWAPQAQKPSSRLIWSISWPWAPNGPRRLSECSFAARPGLERQTTPESSQKAHLDSFLASGAKWFQKLSEGLFGAFPSLGRRPQKLSEGKFGAFPSLGCQMVPDALRSLIWNISWPWERNGPKGLLETNLERFLVLAAKWPRDDYKYASSVLSQRSS